MVETSTALPTTGHDVGYASLKLSWIEEPNRRTEVDGGDDESEQGYLHFAMAIEMQDFDS